MASGFFAVLDDITALLDDVAAMSKYATKKTAGILGDDLAVNAEKASGFVSKREIPVLWAITKGSFLNKLIILPVVFILSALLPVAVIGLLLLGGLYLAFEGAEKIYEWIVPHKKPHPSIASDPTTSLSLADIEKKKIKSAILTDFILSAEIVIIALGTVIEEPLLNQIIVVSVVALIATIGVYGIVAIIVRMDDFGAKLVNLNERDNSISDIVGRFLINALPILIRLLSIAGTLALLLVSGGIFLHNVPFLHDILPNVPAIIVEFVVGLIVGILCLLIYKGIKSIFFKAKSY